MLPKHFTTRFYLSFLLFPHMQQSAGDSIRDQRNAEIVIREEMIITRKEETFVVHFMLLMKRAHFSFFFPKMGGPSILCHKLL